MMGENFEYFLEVTNLSKNTLKQVVVNDKLSNNFKLVNATPKYSSLQGGAVSWALGQMAAGEKRTIRVTGSARDMGTLSCCASVSYDSNLCSNIQVVKPALQVTRVAPKEVLKCDPITLKYTVRNPGSGMARGVKVTEQLPAGLTTKSGSRTVMYDAGDLGAGKSKSFSVVVNASKRGEFTGQANANARSGLKAQSSPMTTVIREPSLTISQSCPEKALMGRKVRFDIKVRNTGNATAEEVTVTNPLPRGAKFLSATNGGTMGRGVVTWQLDGLAPGATESMSYTVKSDAGGSLPSTATAQTYCAPKATANCQVVVKGIPAVLLEVVDVNDPVEVGDTEVYRITVTNQGTAADTNIKILATLESGMEFVNTTGITKAGSTDRGQIVFNALSSLKPKQKASWEIRVRAAKQGDKRFRVKMTTDALERPVEETEATNFYE